MALVEQWKETADAHLYGSGQHPGLIQQMQEFFNARKRRDNSLAIKVSIASILSPIIVMLVMHWLGWHS